VSISGKLFQFNIGSNISFQLRANFASLHNNRAQAGNQLDPRQENGLAESNRHADKAKRNKQDHFYEIVGPYVDDPAALAQGANPAMLELPERTVAESALLPAEASSSDRRVAISPHWRAGTQQNLPDSRTGYIHSYNRHGQTVFADLQIPAVDFVI